MVETRDILSAGPSRAAPGDLRAQRNLGHGVTPRPDAPKGPHRLVAIGGDHKSGLTGEIQKPKHMARAEGGGEGGFRIKGARLGIGRGDNRRGRRAGHPQPPFEPERMGAIITSGQKVSVALYERPVDRDRVGAQ